MDDDTLVPRPADGSASAPLADDPALASDPVAPPERQTSPIPFVAVLFILLFLAIVLIAATGDPYGAGCGGG